MLRNNLFQIISALLLAVLFVIVPGSAFADLEEEVTILFTHDLHDNLYPFPVVEDGVSEYVGGYARIDTAIEKERERHENTILVDAGDYAMGTLFQTIFGTESPTLRFMGQFGYDAVTFGNHEFDYRAGGLADSLHVALESGDELTDIMV